MAEITLKLGHKGEPSGQRASAIAEGKRPVQTTAAEGQYPPFEGFMCYNCYAMNAVYFDPANPDSYVGFYCWNCGVYNVI